MSGEKAQSDSAAQPARLMSLDAYRGFTMLMMASSGLALSRLASNPEIVARFDGSGTAAAWRYAWELLAYHTSHVEWTGCSAWDLIQPAFMFMVGVSMPFSLARRSRDGQSFSRQLLHAAWRSVLLVALGVFLSMSGDGVRTIFPNVLAQIGLGYTFLFLLHRFSLRGLGVAATVVLGSYAAWFALQPIDAGEVEMTKRYLAEVQKVEPSEWSQFSGWASHWNKHTNAAAQFDRSLLNKLPQSDPVWNGRRFWANAGGYQTLNFIPSLATMIFGLMAGLVLQSGRSDGDKLRWLIRAGLVCFVIAMAADTTTWPVQWLSKDMQAKFAGFAWTVCPAVKRIWSPTWAVFSSGWTFWFLAFFYWFVDVRGFRRLAFPLAVVGLNSIAMYCMAQLISGWIGVKTWHIARAVDQLAGWESGISYLLDTNANPWAPLCDRAARLFVMWCICLWMYRRRIYIRL